MKYRRSKATGQLKNFSDKWVTYCMRGQACLLIKRD